MSPAEQKRQREREYRRANPETMYRIRERRRQKMIGAGNCAVCKQAAAPGKTLCTGHLKDTVQRNRARRAKSLELGRCTYCHQRPSLPTHRACAECHEKRNSLAGQCKKYGITIEEFRGMESAQGGKCAICHVPPKHGRLRIDHDHSTNKVRGLLCHNCNTAIGHFRENQDVMARAIEYVKRGGYASVL